MVLFRKWRKVLVIGCLMIAVLCGIYYSSPPKYRSVKFVPIQKLVRNSNLNSKWMVINSDDIQIDNINSLIVYNPEWKLLLVTEQNVRFRNTIVVNPKDFSQSFRSTQHVNINYTRKNIGYLEAMARGAEIIYDLSDSIRAKTTQKWSITTTWKTMHALLFAGSTNYFNPYSHFGQSAILPTGLPKFTQHEKYNKYLVSIWRIPSIQYGMVSGIQNVGKIKGTQLQSGETNVIVKSQTPPVLIPRNVFSLFNSDNTVFRYQALWALLLPKTVSFKDAEVVRSFWVQRLLWEIDEHVGFHPTSLNYNRNKNHVKVKQSSENFSEKFVNFLKDWTCPESYSFFGCVELLSFSLQKYKLWDVNNYDIVKAWIMDLRALGYSEPQRQFVHSKSTSRKFKEISESHAIFNQPALLFYPPLEKTTSFSSSHFEAIRKMCPNHTEPLTKLAKNNIGKLPLKNIMLVVAFNTPFTKVIQKIHPIHSVYFKHIVYCSNNSVKFIEDTKNFYTNVTFLRTYVGEKGALHYLCLNRAMSMNFDVEGYLLSGDDVLLNSWKFAKAPTDKIWFHLPPMYFYRNGSPQQDKWSWWNKTMGKLAFNEMWNDMSNVIETGNARDREILGNFRSVLKANLRGKGDLFRAVADVVYIPKRLKRRTMVLTDFFARHNVMVELALPTIIGGLDNFHNFYRMRGLNLWHKSRNNFDRYKPDLHFLHPVKLSKIEKEKQKFVCSRYLPRLLE